MKGGVAKTGMQQAPHRPLFNVLGTTEKEVRKLLVGTVSSYNEIVPGHVNLDEIVDAAELGIAMTSGTPVVFPTIAVYDGIATRYIGMKYSLATRDSIVDFTECITPVYWSDASVMVLNCDKDVPRLLMAAARISMLTVFVNGGPMLADHAKEYKTNPFNTSETMGAYVESNTSEEDVEKSESKARPTCGSYSGIYTVDNMNCLTEVLGMGLRGNGTTSVVCSEHIKLAKYTGVKVTEMHEKNIHPRDIVIKEALMNAPTMDMAPGCSTNNMSHLPAIVHEVGVELSMDTADEINAKTPNLYHLMPTGPAYTEDLNEAGGIHAVVKEISKKGLLNLGYTIVTDKTAGENIKDCVSKNPEIIRPVENPYNQTGGIAMLKGSPASDSVMVKRSAVTPEMLKYEGPVRIFGCKGGIIDIIKNGRIVTGDMVVIRCGKSKGDPGMREMPNLTSVITNMGLSSTAALVISGRFSDAPRGASTDHTSPKVVVGGPIAPAEEGGIISTDIDNYELNVLVSDQEMEARKTK